MVDDKTTESLNKVLRQTKPEKISDYLEKNSSYMVNVDKPFYDYMVRILKKKNLKQQELFIDADISDRYGYKLIHEEKHTRQRDIILRLCYAAKLSLDETQKALKYYRMPELYAKIPRDALIMVAFNERPGSIIDVNSFLKSNGMDVLRSSGVQE